jgi:pimeloyl-ACP methyl ester carboxylesterase
VTDTVSVLVDGSVEVDGGLLPTMQAGDGPPVVLCHAGVGDMTMWTPQFALADEFRVIAYDARGFGRSESEPGVFSPIDDLRRVVESVGSPVALVGCSMGAAAALEYAAASPDSVWAVGWICGGIWASDRPADPVERAYQEHRAVLLKNGEFDELATIDAAFWVDGPRTPNRAASSVRKAVRQMIVRNFSRDDGGLVIDHKPAAGTERLRSISCPVLLTVGNFDAIAIEDAAQTLMRTLPNVRRIDVPSAHMPNLELPIVMTSQLREFLRSAWSHWTR